MIRNGVKCVSHDPGFTRSKRTELRGSSSESYRLSQIGPIVPHSRPSYHFKNYASMGCGWGTQPAAYPKMLSVEMMRVAPVIDATRYLYIRYRVVPI